jgi:hypothetical protein
MEVPENAVYRLSPTVERTLVPSAMMPPLRMASWPLAVSLPPREEKPATRSSSTLLVPRVSEAAAAGGEGKDVRRRVSAARPPKAGPLALATSSAVSASPMCCRMLRTP